MMRTCWMTTTYPLVQEPFQFDLHEHWNGFFIEMGTMWLDHAIKCSRIPQSLSNRIQRSAHHALCLMSLEELR